MKPILKTFPQQWKNYSAKDQIDRKHVQNGLIDALGNYCSYCELPLSGYEIEHHKHHKFWQSKVVTEDWANLLLCCKDCRDHVRDEKLSQNEKEDLLWPDEHITFSLDKKSPLVYEQREMRYLVLNENKTHVDETKKMVFLVPNPLAGEEMYQKAKNTIDHFQLNMRKDYYTEGSNTLVVPYHHHHQQRDSRTIERSKAWEEAEAAILRLKQITDHPDLEKFPEVEGMMHDQISTTAYFKGNWSVWMTVFNKNFPNNHQLLHRLFVKDDRYFKAIDLQKLGLKI